MRPARAWFKNRQAGKVEMKFYVAGKEFCSVSWSEINFISKMMKDISFGENHVAHVNQGTQRVKTPRSNQLELGWRDILI